MEIAIEPIKALKGVQLAPMSYQPIENYGIIGNMRTAALVDMDGAIDWLCLPRFDSGASFAADAESCAEDACAGSGVCAESGAAAKSAISNRTIRRITS